MKNQVCTLYPADLFRRIRRPAFFQMTSVNLCDYYRDVATCAYTAVQGLCGNDTGISLTGLLDILAHQRIVNCSFRKAPTSDPLLPVIIRTHFSAQCGEGNYCQWGQICRSARTCACATVCPQLSEPVCGNNGLNYANPCLMRNDACTTSTWLIKRPQAYCGKEQRHPLTA